MRSASLNPNPIPGTNPTPLQGAAAAMSPRAADFVTAASAVDIAFDRARTALKAVGPGALGPASSAPAAAPQAAALVRVAQRRG